MRRRLHWVVLLSAACAPAAANDDILPPFYASAELSRQASLTLPLEQILSDLSGRLGYSFIFDSRVTKGKTAPPLDTFAPTDVALKACLKTANLSLHKINEKTYAITSAPRVAAPVMDIAAANAAAAAPILVDAIVVTATAAAPLAVGSPNILSIDEEALELTNAVAPAETIYELPQSFSTYTPANTMFLGLLSGVSLVDLRGLGPQRTMTLLNGRRRTPTPGGDTVTLGVDLNAMAEPFIARIEVIPAPGGASGGHDAIAGSVNFVTKRRVNGIEAGAQFGISQHADAEEGSVYVLAGGRISDGIDVSAGVNVTTQEGLLGADRENTAVSWGANIDGSLTPGFGGSTLTPWGALGGAVLADGSVASLWPRAILNGNGGIAPFNSPSQLFSPNPTQQFIVPADRLLSFVSLDADAAENVEIFADIQLAWARNYSQIAPLPAGRPRGSHPLLGDAVAIDINHPTVPTDVAALFASEFGGSADAVILERRFVELGPREQRNDRSYIDAVAGARIASGPVNVELAYRFGRSAVLGEQRNLLDRNNLAIALDDAACAATAGCATVDLFRTGGISAPAADFLRAAPLRRRVSLEEHEVRVVADAGFHNILADTLEVSAGVELRRARLRDDALTTHDDDVVGAFLPENARGVLNTADIFSSIDAPILRNPAIGDFDLSVASRVTASSESDPAFNVEIAPIYAPTEGIELFAQLHLGRRPPNIVELLGAAPSTYWGFSDPCDPLFFPQSNTLVENCAGVVGPGFSQTALLARTTSVSNPDLEPEEVKSQAYGAAVAPTEFVGVIPGSMKLSATWLSYEIGNLIDGTSYPLEDCYLSVGLSDAACGVNPHSGLPLIRRDPATQQVVAFESLLQNGGTYRWRGVDFAFDYAFEPENLGPIDRLWINALHTLAFRADYTWDGKQLTNLVGSVTDPRHVSRISVGGEAGPVALNVFLQRRSAVLTAPANGVVQSLPNSLDEVIPASLLIDLTTRVQVREGVVATFAVENLTNHVAPVVAIGSVGNTFPEYYDLIGRRFSIAIKGAF